MATRRAPDLYAVLGVPADASADDIRKAYRRLARELHPDVNADPAAVQRFKEVTAAYEILGDPAKRRRYDLFGAQGGSMDSFPFQDLGDIFEVFFGGGFGGPRRRTRGPRRTRAERGSDSHAVIELSFEEAVFGVSKDIPIQTLEICERCEGTGCEPGTHPSVCSKCSGAGEVQEVQRSIFGTVMTATICPTCQGTGQEITTPCTTCRGDGRTLKSHLMAVEVPPGVTDGLELRISGGGHGGRAGGPSGDLYCSLQVQPHPVFERRGQDLFASLPIPMTQAALGTEVEIDTLDGTERLKIEPGVASGTEIRFRGRGVPHLGRRGRGDLFVTVEVETPAGLKKEERRLVEQLAELRGEAGRKGRRASLRRPQA